MVVPFALGRATIHVGLDGAYPSGGLIRRDDPGPSSSPRGSTVPKCNAYYLDSWRGPSRASPAGFSGAGGRVEGKLASSPRWNVTVASELPRLIPTPATATKPAADMLAFKAFASEDISAAQGVPGKRF